MCEIDRLHPVECSTKLRQINYQHNFIQEQITLMEYFLLHFSSISQHLYGRSTKYFVNVPLNIDDLLRTYVDLYIFRCTDRCYGHIVFFCLKNNWFM